MDTQSGAVWEDNGGVTMAVFSHKDYYIRVYLYTPRFESSFIPSVEVSAEREGASMIGMTTTEAFTSESDANDHGFEMGRNWIDQVTGKQEVTCGRWG